MGLKTNESLLTQNLELRKENKQLTEDFHSAISDLSCKFDRVIVLLEKQSQTPIYQMSEMTETQTRPKVVEKAQKVFIPTPDTDGMVANVSEIPKKTRETDIKEKVKKLSKLNGDK